jgi:hypothetical protein
MTYRVCPKCTSWRLLGVETGLFRDRLLNTVNLRLYHCKDCGWQGIAKSKEKRNLIKFLLQSSAWKNILFSFLMLVGIYAVSNILLTIIGKHASNEQTDSPVTVIKAASVSTTVTPTKNTSVDAVVAAQPLSASIQELRVIGNRDSKRYHLPGMKYYHLVEAHHRVEFSSEDEAIKAGYHKAPK